MITESSKPPSAKKAFFCRPSSTKPKRRYMAMARSLPALASRSTRMRPIQSSASARSAAMSRLPGAAAGELVVHGDAEPGRVPPLAVAQVQAGVADDAAVELGDEDVIVLAPAAVEVGRALRRHRRREAHDLRLPADVHERRRVLGAHGADYEVARRDSWGDCITMIAAAVWRDFDSPKVTNATSAATTTAIRSTSRSGGARGGACCAGRSSSASILGRYQILGPLGEGGMGVVYRARDAELGRDVAVKLVTTCGASSDTLATRLMREAQALAQLSHPNVVAVYDVGRVEDGVFLAMELVAGRDGRRVDQEAAAVARGAAASSATPGAAWPRRTRSAWCTATSSRPT